MSPYRKRLLRDLEARVMPWSVLFLLLFALLSTIFFVVDKNVVTAEGGNIATIDFEEGSGDGDNILGATGSDWFKKGTMTNMAFKYNTTTKTNGSYSARFSQSGDPGGFDDSIVYNNNITSITSNCTIRFNVYLDFLYEKNAFRVIDNESTFDGIDIEWDEHKSVATNYGPTPTLKYFYNGSGNGGSETVAIISEDVWYTFNLQINFTDKNYFIEYGYFSSGYLDYLCFNADGSGKWIPFRANGGSLNELDCLMFTGSSLGTTITTYYDQIEISSGLINYNSTMNPPTGENDFNITDLDANDRVTFGSGGSGDTLYSNATGNWGSGAMMNITFSINSSVKVTDIFIDFNETNLSTYIHWENISISCLNGSNTSWGTFKSIPDIDQVDDVSNVSLNASWNNTWGSNPFPFYDAGEGVDGYINVRFKLFIPDDATVGVFTTDEWDVVFKVEDL